MAKPRVLISWPRGTGGVPTSVTDDVTADIISEIDCWRGRSYQHTAYRATGVGVAGHARFTLRNVNDKYTLTREPIGAKVQIQVEYRAGTYRTLWTGYLDTYEYQHHRQGYDRVEVIALGIIAQLETATWSIAPASPDPRAYDVIATITQNVTGVALEEDYDDDDNNTSKAIMTPALAARDWNVRLQNYELREAPALDAIRDAANISFAHVYETRFGRLRIQGLADRQKKIDASPAFTFNDAGSGTRVSDYDIRLQTDRIANAAAQSIYERFERAEVDEPETFISETGTKLTRGATTRDITAYLFLDRFRGIVDPSAYSGAHGFLANVFYFVPPETQTYVSATLWPFPGGMRLRANFVPESYIYTDPNGVLDPVETTPDPFSHTIDFQRATTRADRRVNAPNAEGVRLWNQTRPPYTESDDSIFSIVNIAVGYTNHPRVDFTEIGLRVTRPVSAPSEWNWSWSMELLPIITAGSSGQVLHTNSASITKWGRRGYAVPGVYWGPDVSTGSSDYLDIRSFVGYIVRDDFLGQPGYYGTIVVDLTQHYYPHSTVNPSLDVGQHIRLRQGQGSGARNREFLISAIRYRFRQGEQLRAQIECAPARLM